jgi:dipeptidyl aminopeptidase/acylaminoacyl peptidase
VSLSQTSDGEAVVCVHEFLSGKEVACFAADKKSLQTMAFSPDGRRIVSGLADGSMTLWDVETGSEIAHFSGHRELFTALAFSPDGRRIASGSSDNTVRIWDADEGIQLIELIGHERGIKAVAFSPDGRRLASAGGRADTSEDSFFPLGGTAPAEEISSWCLASDSAVRVWDLDSGTEIVRFEGHCDTVVSLAFSPDGRLIASGSDDESTKVWDAESGSQIILLDQHENQSGTLVFSCDGRRIGGRNSAHEEIWDAESGESLRCRRTGAAGIVMFVNSCVEQPLLSLNAVVDRRDGMGDTIVKATPDDRSIAWFPHIRSVSEHPAGRLWAGLMEGGYLCLVHLEGDPTTPAIETEKSSEVSSHSISPVAFNSPTPENKADT